MKPHAATSKTWQGYVVQAVREVAASRRADDEAKELGKSVSGFGGKQITPEQVTQNINKAREALERRKTELQAKRRKSVSGRGAGFGEARGAGFNGSVLALVAISTCQGVRGSAGAATAAQKRCPSRIPHRSTTSSPQHLRALHVALVPLPQRRRFVVSSRSRAVLPPRVLRGGVDGGAYVKRRTRGRLRERR